PLLRGERVRFEGTDLTGRGNPPAMSHRPSLLLAALAPRMLRLAGTHADGTVLWLATPHAIDAHVIPVLRQATDAAGRPPSRVVAGLPVAVHDDLDEARAAIVDQIGFYDGLPNYRRILNLGGVASVADAAALGDEAAVTAQLQGLLDAGATDIWASIVGVGADPAGSIARTEALLASLAGA
ncbi:MAG TPA: LLM class flavin-dependent oxidoreductase, partial [Acidimicrobiales bacterium]